VVRCGLPCPKDVGRVHHAVAVVHRQELDARVHGGRGVLVRDNVLTPARHDCGPGGREHAERDLIRHDARRHEQRRRLGEALGEGFLEGAHGRVLAVVVVAHLRLCHGPPHRGCGAGDGVAPQVDQGGHALRLTVRR